MDSEFEILIVDDDVKFSKSLKRLINSMNYSCHVYNDPIIFAHEKLRIDKHLKGCLFLDIRMHNLNGLKLFDKINSLENSMSVIFLTGRGNIPTSVKMIKKGAYDFIEKPINEKILQNIICNAISDSKEKYKKFLRKIEITKNFQRLTPREREIFKYVSKGLLNKQIAYELGIVEKTVKVHRARVMSKMESKSLADLVRNFEFLKSKKLIP